MAEERAAEPYQTVRFISVAPSFIGLIHDGCLTISNQSRMSIYTIQGEPLFYESDDGGPIYPTLRVLHKCAFSTLMRKFMIVNTMQIPLYYLRSGSIAELYDFC